MRYVAFDIESAITVRDHSDMCAFGYAVADENFEITEVKEIRIRPKRFTKRLEEMLGVTMDDLEEAPLFRDVYDEIAELLEHPDQMIFAHSAISDLVFLGRECRKNSLRTPRITVYDTHVIYPSYTGAERKALTDTKEWSGAEFENHKASEDAKACLFVPKKIFETEGKNDFKKIIEGYDDAAVRTEDAELELDHSERRAKADRLFTKKYQERTRPTGKGMKGITVSMSKDIVNKHPDIVTKAGNMVLRDSGKLTKEINSADIHILRGEIGDNRRVHVTKDGKNVVKMNDSELSRAIRKGNVTAEIKRLIRKWEELTDADTARRT